MHNLGDLLLEAVINSDEAGCNRVELSLKEKDGIIEVSISDNGSLICNDDFFAEGFSSKGDGRGRGLSLIKSLDRDARLYRDGDESVLVFKARNDGSLERLEDVLFPIFQRVDNTRFTYIKDGKCVISIERNGERLESAKEIKLFKDIVRSRKGVNDV